MATQADPKIIEKIPFFHGLSNRQVQQVLKSGRLATYTSGQVLCKIGDPSTGMFILLSGELAIIQDNAELARVQPVDIVGEMGVITNQPRCASVSAVADSSLVVIDKMRFDVLLKNDLDIAVRIYRNTIHSICGRLREDNAQLAKVLLQEGINLAAATV